MNTNLKPCPFCGCKEPYFIECTDFNGDNNTRENYYYVLCPDCRIQTDYMDTPEEAKSVWNRRYPNNKTLSKKAVQPIALSEIQIERQDTAFIPTYICPTCGKEFSGWGIMNFCYKCGQAFDWTGISKKEQESED